MGCLNRGAKLPCLGYSSQMFAVSPMTFIKRRSTLIIDSYVIGEKLGAGAYGVVRLARHIATNEQRAIKSINKQRLSEDQLRSCRFFNELDILVNSDHPNIVRLFEFYEDDKYWHLVTEYLSGGELFDYLIENRSLNEQIAAGYIIQLLGAVSYCHSKGVVHRDLKPENLLLDETQKSVKVIDFGASSIFTGPFTKKVGTSYYIAPEVLRGHYDEKCDLWSVGVILYLLLSGKPPFPGKNDSEILMNVEKGIYSMNYPEWSHISSQAKDLVKCLLTYNPSYRISASAALNHPWLLTHFLSSSLPTLTLKSLSQFHTSQRLKSAVLTFIASQLLQAEEFQEISEIFRNLDKNNDGKISKEELKAVCDNKRLNIFENPDKMMREIDINKSGFIDYTEFLVACRKEELGGNVKRLEAAFRCFDVDRNGKITAEELKEVLADGEGGCEVWREVIREVDVNGDGEVDLNEFFNMMIEMAKK